MITQSIIYKEFDLAKKIYLYYMDKMADYVSVGSNKYIQWYKDLCILYYLTQMLESVYVENQKLYLGSQEIDDDFFTAITSNVREYLTNDIRELAYAGLDSMGNVNDYTNPQAPVTVVSYSNYVQDWKSAIIEITQDDVTTVTLPFDIANTDPESIRVTMGDSDPIFITDPEEEGFHIVGNTLFWHNYFNLKEGDRIYIQYLEVSN